MRIKALRAAFPRTLPVMTGYLFLGIAFGVLLREAGFGPLWALLMSGLIYAGSMQFVAVGLLGGPFAPLTAGLVAFTVNARHLFYGLSMLGRFAKRGGLKPYLIFGLTDETYSLLCAGDAPEGVDKGWYDFFLTALDHLYWVSGSLLGSVMGAALPFDSTGIDFAMTALFLVIFVEQWESADSHLPALLGIGITLACLLIFGADNFLLFSMAGILAALLLFRRQLDSPANTADPGSPLTTAQTAADATTAADNGKGGADA